VTDSYSVTANGDGTIDIDEARTRLYEVLERDDLPVVDRYRQALSVGCAYLGVENGHLKRIPGPDGSEARVSVASGNVSWISGDTALEAAGFCRMTLEREDSLGIADAVAEGFGDNPGYADHGVACYLAAPVTVGGETYGTACFVSSEPRATQFVGEERLFVELLAQILGRQLEKEHHVEALAESRSKYRSLIDAAPDAVFLLDTETLSVVDANETAVGMVGYSQEELDGLAYPELLATAGEWATAESVDWFTGEGTRRTGPDGSALVLERADGSEIPVEITASRVALGDRELVHAVARDIRDEKARERRTEAIFDQTHQFTGLLSPDGTLIEANDTAMSVCEESRAEILGRPFWECPWWQTDAAARERLRDAVERAADGEFVRYEVEIATATGRMMVDFSIRPVTDDEGEVELLIPEGRDITDRYERDRQLDVLARVLRHNVRNDITVIRGYADHLSETVDGELAGAAERVRGRADALADQVEAYRRTVELLGDPPDPMRIELTDRLSELVLAERDSYPAADIELTMPDSAPVRAVPAIDQALTELLDNALTHSDDGSPTLTVSVERERDCVTVTIADDGPGIPPQEARILTGDQSIGQLDHGSGIGLWRAFWICDLSGGDIMVDTDDGTAVTVSLPAAD